MANPRKWNSIVIHHSISADHRLLSNFEAIRKWHIRHNGWTDIGYHYVIEYEDGEVVLKQGRGLDKVGSHTIGMNKKAIGICLVGNYDHKEPTGEQYRVLAGICSTLMDKFHIQPERIFPHSFFSEKTCPGRKFNWSKFIIRVLEV